MKFDAAVIGSGPAGITAAMYLVRSGCSVILFEKLTPGGQVLLTDQMENYPGFPKGIKGWELADAFSAHLDDLKLDRRSDNVLSIEGSVGQFTLTTEGGEFFEAATVIVATGAKHRELGLDREEILRGRGVSYCAVCDGNFFRGRSVAVVGGGNSALEESLYLSRIVSKLYLIHRRDAFRGADIYQKKIRACENVELVLSSTVTELQGNPDLSSILVKNVKTGEIREISVDGIFVFVGTVPVADFVPTNVERDKGGFLITDTEMRTNVAGIFAAGDVRSKLCRQVVTAAGDGATAAQAAFLFLEQLHG